MIARTWEAHSFTHSSINDRGFSLIELIVALAIAAIALTLAIPSFTRSAASNRLTTAADQYVGLINIARMEAVKRNSPVQFCGNTASTNSSSTLGTQCGTSAGAVWSLNADGSATKIEAAPTLPDSIQIASVNALQFSGNGLATNTTSTAPYTGLVVDIFSNQIQSNNHRCVYMTTGSALGTCSYTSSSTQSSCPIIEPSNCTESN